MVPSFQDLVCPPTHHVGAVSKLEHTLSKIALSLERPVFDFENLKSEGGRLLRNVPKAACHGPCCGSFRKTNSYNPRALLSTYASSSGMCGWPNDVRKHRYMQASIRVSLKICAVSYYYQLLVTPSLVRVCVLKEQDGCLCQDSTDTNPSNSLSTDSPELISPARRRGPGSRSSLGPNSTLRRHTQQRQNAATQHQAPSQKTSRGHPPRSAPPGVLAHVKHLEATHRDRHLPC